jgi:UDP-N-acetylglucosamine--dolichyl-phosphate N-acetylglucosaminephosphotransferase
VNTFLNIYSNSTQLFRINYYLFKMDISNRMFKYWLFISFLFVLLECFCTHSINIYAGINGLEVGQSIIISCFLLFHSMLYWSTDSQSQESAVVLVPFIFTSFAFLYYNWYPSKVFVGDSFTLTAGAAIAAAGTLWHFGEMTLLFMLPQLINFVLSLPQLFGIFTCQRHRLPRYNAETEKLEVIHTNLNLINCYLIIRDQMSEDRLCIELLLFQIFCWFLAYFVRYLYHIFLHP